MVQIARTLMISAIPAKEGTFAISLHVEKKTRFWSQMPATVEYNPGNEEIDTSTVPAG